MKFFLWFAVVGSLLFALLLLVICQPGLLTVALLEFLWSWNDLLLPLVFLVSDELRTLPVGMLFFQGRFTIDYGLMSAGVLIISLPVTVLFLIFYIPYKLAILFFCTGHWLFDTYRNSRTGITRQYVRTMKTDLRNVCRMPLTEDETECALNEARASFLRRLKKELWE